MSKKCAGCGIELQNIDEFVEGFFEGDMSRDGLVCKRCFRIKNYGDYSIINRKGPDFKEIFGSIRKTGDLVLCVVDLFNLSNNLENLITFFKYSPVILVLSKRDVLPKSVKDEKLIEYLNLNLDNLVDTIIISSEKNYNIDKLYESIEKNKISKNVYIMGYTNSGKSSLINVLIKNYSNHNLEITTSLLPNTTIDKIFVPLDETLTLIDTPGLLEEDNLLNISYDLYNAKKIAPQTEIRPIVYQTGPGKSILIENYVRLDYVDGGKNSFVLYISNQLKSERINEDTNRKFITGMDKHEFYANEEEDIVIKGIGFIKVSKAAHVKVFVKKDVGVYTRKSLI